MFGDLRPSFVVPRLLPIFQVAIGIEGEDPLKHLPPCLVYNRCGNGFKIKCKHLIIQKEHSEEQEHNIG